jgi:hypothetical protein
MSKPNPTQKQIDETMAEIYKMLEPHIKAQRRVEFLKRPDTLIDKNGNLFVKFKGKLYPVEEPEHE